MQQSKELGKNLGAKIPPLYRQRLIMNMQNLRGLKQQVLYTIVSKVEFKVKTNLSAALISIVKFGSFFPAVLLGVGWFMFKV